MGDVIHKLLLTHVCAVLSCEDEVRITFLPHCTVEGIRFSYMGSVSVSSCRWCMFVACVHPVAVLNAAFYMTRILLMLVKDARGDHMEEAYPTAGIMTAL